MTVLSDADARAHYRAVVARVDAIYHADVHGHLRTVEGDTRFLNAACLRALRRIRQGAVRQLRALGERV